jgi:hypothetical protein
MSYLDENSEIISQVFYFALFGLVFAKFPYFFIFIGSPQHVILPTQQESVEHFSSLHSFSTLSSKPHPSQERT